MGHDSHADLPMIPCGPLNPATLHVVTTRLIIYEQKSPSLTLSWDHMFGKQQEEIKTSRETIKNLTTNGKYNPKKTCSCLVLRFLGGDTV